VACRPSPLLSGMRLIPYNPMLYVCNLREWAFERKI
jgi:hypothetical protein